MPVEETDQTAFTGDSFENLGCMIFLSAFYSLSKLYPPPLILQIELNLPTPMKRGTTTGKHETRKNPLGGEESHGCFCGSG